MILFQFLPIDVSLPLLQLIALRAKHCIGLNCMITYWQQAIDCASDLVVITIGCLSLSLVINYLKLPYLTIRS